MSLDTKVKNLIINTNMTKEQYEAIDDKSNQLFFVEDSSVVDVPAPEENQSGYLHTDGANLTWKEIESGDKLPDQSDNAGKFLTTDGTTASWGNAISIKEQGVGNEGVIAISSSDMTYGNYNNNSVIIGKGDHGQGYGGVVAIGSNAKVTASSASSIAIGYYAQAGYDESVVIGSRSTQKPGFGNAGQVTVGSFCTSSGSRAIVLGYECAVDGNYAIQLGGKKATNSDANTFKVGNANGNFEMMSADGTIPTDRYTTTPTDAGTYVPKLTIAEDGTATREWGTESGGSVSGDYLPLSGGTLTGQLKFDYNPGNDTGIVFIDDYGFGGGQIRYFFGGAWGGSVLQFQDLSLEVSSMRPISNYVGSLGEPKNPENQYAPDGLRYNTVYTKYLGNGEYKDKIEVPENTSGTMVVATPPTDNGTYVLKATVVDGVVTTEWVLEA